MVFATVAGAALMPWSFKVWGSKALGARPYSSATGMEETLKDREAHSRGITTYIADAVVTINAQGEIQSFNPAAESMFGFDAAEVIGKNVSILMPEPDHSKHDGYIQAFLETGKGKILGVGAREVTARRKDGSVFAMELTVGDMMLGSGTVFVGAMRDITERKQAEEALRVSEERFRDFATVSSDWFWEKDENLRFSYFSERLISIIGVTPDHLLGRTREESGVEDSVDPETWRGHLDDLQNYRPFRNFSFSRVKPNGEIVWLSISGNPIFDDAGAFKGYRGTGSDITEHKRAEEALRQSEAKFRDLVEGSIQGVLIYDKNWNILFANQAIADMLGYSSPDDVLTLKSAGKILLPEDRHRIAKYRHARFGGGGAPEWFEFRGLRKDGSAIWLENMARIIEWDGTRAVLLTMIDIDERKRAEKKLWESNARLQAILDYSPAKIHIKDPEGRYTLINKRSEELFGVTEIEARGRTSREIFPEAVADAFTGHDQKVLDYGKPMEEEEEWHHEDGVHTYLTVKFPIHDTSGKVSAVGAIGTDITERKQTESLLQEAKKQAEVANRSKSEFLANMSHELRTPLNAIIGFSEMILRGMLGPVGNAKYLEYAKDINGSGQHLLALINDILDLSKIEAGKLELHDEVVDLTEVLNASMALVKERAEEAALSLKMHVSNRLPAIIADQIKVKQALINLLTNAVKFTGSGGTVSVHAFVEPNGDLAVQVADTGVGIAADDIPKVMEPFGQADNSLTRQHQGTGLGLPLSKALIELHEGTLEMESEIGVGTTVTIRFPAKRVRDCAA